MPKWEESVEGCRDRYVKVVKALADKYPSENLLLVTHGKTKFLTLFCASVLNKGGLFVKLFDLMEKNFRGRSRNNILDLL